MDIEQALDGMRDAMARLSTRTANTNPALLSEHMYRLGQYTAALEMHLGDAEEELEIEWAKKYTINSVNLSATAAKQKTDVETAEAKGNTKRLARYVSAGWKTHTGAMARVNHLTKDTIGHM